MSLVRWQPCSVLRTHPLQEVNSIPQDLDHIFDWAFGGTDMARWNRPMMPAIDVTEEESRYMVHVDLPGFHKDDIEVTYHDGCLTLKGEKRTEKREEKTEEKGRFYHRERFEGKFGRNIQLPEKIDPEKIEASFKDGVLELTLPFTPEAQPRKIQIGNV